MPLPVNQPDLTAEFAPGMRVVVRHRTADGVTDALGDVSAVDAASLEVTTRRGPVRIDRRSVLAAKRVPPRAVRRGRPHLALSMTDLQELMVGGMPPLRSHWLGRWLLRESAGYTGRANSVLPIGDPGMPLPDALAYVEDWYATRGGMPLLQIFGPDDFVVADDVVGGAALAAGWTAFQPTLVMTASVAALAGGVACTGLPAALQIGVRAEATDGWWTGAMSREQAHRETAAAIFDLIPDGEYITLSLDSCVVAVGRVAYSPGWAGAFSVHVSAQHRGHGFAREVMAAAARRAQARGIPSMYLQVSRSNTAAVRLYESLGFRSHHEYWYLRAPSPTAR